jgi:hypothetical protein
MSIRKWLHAWWHPEINWDQWFPDSLKGTNRDYSSFIVLGTGRTGSSLLVSSLRSHPAVLAFSELINPNEIQFNTPPFDNHNRHLIRLRMRRTAEFLDNLVYRPVASSIQAIGFKAFYRHLHEIPALGKYLLAHQDIKTIHLKRRNLLRAFVSSQIAAKTKVYGMSSTDARQKTTVRIDIDKCLRYLQNQSEAVAQYDALLSDRTVLHIEYADLSDRYEATMLNVQTFLGVGPHQLSSNKMKQNPYLLPEIVENFADLQAALRGLPWEQFLAE